MAFIPFNRERASVQHIAIGEVDTFRWVDGSHAVPKSLRIARSIAFAVQRFGTMCPKPVRDQSPSWINGYFEYVKALALAS